MTFTKSALNLSAGPSSCGSSLARRGRLSFAGGSVVFGAGFGAGGWCCGVCCGCRPDCALRAKAKGKRQKAKDKITASQTRAVGRIRLCCDGLMRRCASVRQRSMARSSPWMTRRLIVGGRIKLGGLAEDELKRVVGESTSNFCLLPFAFCLFMLILVRVV